MLVFIEKMLPMRMSYCAEMCHIGEKRCEFGQLKGEKSGNKTFRKKKVQNWTKKKVQNRKPATLVHICSHLLASSAQTAGATTRVSVLRCFWGGGW